MKIDFSYYLLVIFFCIPLISFGQIKFEKGYYINNENVRTECLIKNADWIYNPVFFEYKINRFDKSSRKNITDVKEFGILNFSKFVRANLNIDRSSDLLDDEEISNNMAPEWKKEELFLKVLIEGEATLYLYEESNFIRFFYKVKNSLPEQLIYKKFKKPGEINFQYNREYINQLNTKVNCNNIPVVNIEKVHYSKRDLSKYFKAFNNCTGNTVSTSFDAKRKKWFSLKPLIGTNYSSFKSGSSFDPTVANISFDSKLSFTAGLEFEFMLPFNNNKWSVILEPSTFSYKASGQNSGGTKAQVDYNSINIAAGLRYKFFLNENSRIFLDAFEIKDIKVTTLRLTPAFGAGYSYKRLSAEVRFYPHLKIYNYYYYATNYASFTNSSFTIKYAVF